MPLKRRGSRRAERVEKIGGLVDRRLVQLVGHVVGELNVAMIWRAEDGLRRACEST